MITSLPNDAYAGKLTYSGQELVAETMPLWLVDAFTQSRGCKEIEFSKSGPKSSDNGDWGNLESVQHITTKYL